mgnify:CR=1 FL=1
MLQFITKNELETFKLGRLLGEEAPAGLVVALNGELGAGKTVFAQGVAAGLGISEQVTSPTFVLMQEYEGGRLPFCHIDAYRLEGDEILACGILESVNNKSLSVVEWAENIAAYLPDDTVWVSIAVPFAEDVLLRKWQLSAEKGQEDFFKQIWREVVDL